MFCLYSFCYRYVQRNPFICRECVSMRPEIKFTRNEISFRHENVKKYENERNCRLVFIGAKLNEIPFFVLILCYTIFVFMKYSHVQMFPLEDFISG